MNPPANTARRRNSAALLVVEQVVAPVDQRAQRLLARQRRAIAAGQQTEAIGQPRRDLLDRQRAHARGGQLERERNAVEALADAGDRRRVVVGDRERRLRRQRALDEQPRRRVLLERMRA